MTPPPPSPTDSDSLDVKNDRVEVDRIIDRIASALDRFGYDKASRFAVKLAVQEGLANAFHHGHKNLPEDVPVHVDYDVGPDQVSVRITDRGPGFDPATVPDPTLDENLERPCGRGIMLIRAYMTDVSFNDSGNQIHMRYDRPGLGEA
ncbi:MAG TPA: ATP-binding protein [Phycisphaerales bacterium]|nr:ATP-binding protein [Phycisphaerales bacterium]